jgi:hypothetical protein
VYIRLCGFISLALRYTGSLLSVSLDIYIERACLELRSEFWATFLFSAAAAGFEPTFPFSVVYFSKNFVGLRLALPFLSLESTVTDGVQRRERAMRNSTDGSQRMDMRTCACVKYGLSDGNVRICGNQSKPFYVQY